MIREIATLTITPDRADDLVVAFPDIADLVRRAPGVHQLTLLRGIEEPSTFVLEVDWDSVAAHETFRSSPDFTEWRQRIGPFLQGVPFANHYRTVD